MATDNGTDTPAASNPAQLSTTYEALKHMVDTIASNIQPFARKVAAPNPYVPHTLQAISQPDLEPIRDAFELYRQLAANEDMDSILRKLSAKFETFSADQSSHELATYLKPLLEGWHNIACPKKEKKYRVPDILGRTTAEPKWKALPLHRPCFVALFRQAAEAIYRKGLPKPEAITLGVRGGLASRLKEE